MAISATPESCDDWPVGSTGPFARLGDQQELNDQRLARGHTNLMRPAGDERCHALASASVACVRLISTETAANPRAIRE
jgi:hypothetical protein